MLEYFLDDILENNFIVIASRPLNGKVELTVHILYEFGIRQKKKIRMFHLDNPSDFYIEKLTSFMSGIPSNEIHQYFHPCMYQRNHFKIKEKPFIKALEEIGNSNIEMIDLKFASLSEDILDYFINYDESDDIHFLIIDTFDSLIKNSNYKKEEILKALKQYSKKYHITMIILSNVERKSEIKKAQTLKAMYHYDSFKKYADMMFLISRVRESENISFSALIYKNKKIKGPITII